MSLSVGADSDARVSTRQVVCKWVVSSGLPQEIGEHFVEHSINGELLLRLQFDDMAQLGVINVGDEFALWERIEVLQRYCKKPNTRVLEVPSYFARLVKTATFAFADTSEGKSTEVGEPFHLRVAGGCTHLRSARTDMRPLRAHGLTDSETCA